MVVTTQIAAFFSALGFAAWFLGHYFEYKGIAVIGGAVVLILGGFVTIDGLQYRVGSTVNNELVTVSNNSTDVNTTDVEVAVNSSEQTNKYRRLSNVEAFRLGFVIMLLGAAMTFQALNMEIQA
jgi:uncharacterized membrane protein